MRELSESLPTLGSDEVQLISGGQVLHLYEVQDIEHWWLVAHPRRMTERELAELLLEHTLLYALRSDAQARPSVNRPAAFLKIAMQQKLH